MTDYLTQGPVGLLGKHSLTQGPDPDAYAYRGGILGKFLARGLMGLLGGPSREEVLGPSVLQQQAQWSQNTQGLPLADRLKSLSPIAQNLGMTAAPIKAYHGSPYSFDKFDASKIGTGEGAQAYGHGLYIAENPKVAESYRAETAFKHGPKDIAEMLYSQKLGNTDQAIKSLTDEISAYERRGWPSADYRNQYDAALAKLQDWQANGPPRKGHTYEVQINAEPHQFLDWDKPLAGQHPEVNQALQSILKDRNRAPGDWIKSSPGAEARMNEAGIPGIKYLDQGSRAAGDGSRNYVVFDPSIVGILRRYGILGPLVGGAAVAEQ